MPGAEFIPVSKRDRREEAAKGKGARVLRVVYSGGWRERLIETVQQIQ